MITGSSITLAMYAQIATTAASEPLRVMRTSTKDVDVGKANLSQVRKSKNVFRSRGIANLGHTCYLVAIVTFATACLPFRDSVTQTPFPDQNIPDSIDVKNEEASALPLAKELRSAVMQIGDAKIDGPFYPEQLERFSWQSDTTGVVRTSKIPLRLGRDTSKSKGSLAKIALGSKEETNTVLVWHIAADPRAPFFYTAWLLAFSCRPIEIFHELVGWNGVTPALVKEEKSG